MLPRKTLAILLTLCLVLAPTVGATWSIVLVDSATGEVAVGSATCLEGTDLRAFVPVIVVGVGAGATQSQVDPTGKHKKLIFNELKLGTPPSEIIDLLKLEETLAGLKCSRQYGVADMFGGSASFSGGCNGVFKGHRFGTIGTVSYAIQGNVITGLPVVLAAEAAIIESQGQLLSDRLMQGMEAARAMGGDGRCSCETHPPADSCGSPPVNGFEKSAHVGTVIVARVGDTDGPCFGGSIGCAGGDYWLNLNVSGYMEDPDPVYILEGQYAAFKERMRGHVDGLKTTATWTTSQPRSGGGGVAQLELALADFEGTPITHGGAKIQIAHAEGSAELSQRQVITDNGDGTYSIRFLATAATGTDRFEITIRDGVRPAVIYPLPEIVYPAPLEASTDEVSSSAGGKVVFTLRGPASAAGKSFVLGLSLDGPDAGLTLPGGLLLPLRSDRLLAATPHLVSAGFLKGVPGELDQESRATVELELPAGLLQSLTGKTLRAAWCTYQPATFASNAVTIRITP
jgi:hypothetical protein